MSRNLTVKTEDKEGRDIYIEVSGNEYEGEYIPAGRVTTQTSNKKFEEVLDSLSPMVDALYNSLGSLETRPTSTKISFKVDFSSELNLTLVKLGGKANLEITLSWGDK